MPYLINSNTLALIPEKNRTKIFEGSKSYIIKEKTNDIVNKSCCYSGSTLQGRQKGVGYLLGSNYKPPIIVDEHQDLILIPTHSMRNSKCTWVVLNNILTYYPAENKVMVEFKNNKKILINCPFTIFDNQVLRATRLESILRGRNIQKHL